MSIFKAIETGRPPERNRIHMGELAILENSEALGKLMKEVEGLLKTALGEIEPQRMHEAMSVREFNERKTELNQKLSENPAVNDLLSSLLNELGWEERPVFFDRLILRLNPPAKFNRSGELTAMRSYTDVHRDTWGVNIMSQINFWMPIFPLLAENTFAFYPDYWDRPLKNNTAEWSFSEYLKRKSEGYPMMPEALEKVPENFAVPALPGRGQMLIFSSAHLHGSLPNLSDLTRVNLETRCYFERDEKDDLGAPNVDTLGRGKAFNLFRELK